MKKKLGVEVVFTEDYGYDVKVTCVDGEKIKFWANTREGIITELEKHLAQLGGR